MLIIPGSLFSQDAQSELLSDASSDLSSIIDQQLDISVEQRTGLWELRKNNPLNQDNWQEQPDWETETKATLDWHIGFSKRLQFNTSGSMDWKSLQGYYHDHSLRYESPDFYLDTALLDFNIHEAGLQIMAGKTMRNYGSAVLLPVTDFLYLDTLERDRINHGKWMAGVSLYYRGLSFETWAAPAASWLHDAYRPRDEGDFDAMILSSAVYSFDIHRLGLVYYHNGAHQLGLFYSGQIGMGLIPYGELAVSNHSLLRNFSPYTSPEGWSVDMVLGGSYAFSRMNGTLYAEYRYRSSGIAPGGWREIGDKLLAEEAAHNYAALGQTAQSLPYLFTPRHTAGIRLQNTRQIGDLFDYSATLFYLAPDGFFIRGEGTLTLLERLKIMVGFSAFPSLADRGEMAFWEKKWQGDITLQWTARTSE
ncbi:MAG: hypothetical protein LBK02_01970 [Treponema sp.]|nr:hypothetical protein [Treponema sp.]